MLREGTLVLNAYAGVEGSIHNRFDYRIATKGGQIGVIGSEATVTFNASCLSGRCTVRGDAAYALQTLVGGEAIFIGGNGHPELVVSIPYGVGYELAADAIPFGADFAIPNVIDLPVGLPQALPFVALPLPNAEISLGIDNR